MHPDFDTLNDAVLQHAGRALGADGRLQPFAATLADDGQVHLSLALPDEQGDDDAAVEMLTSGLRQHGAEGQFVAAALCSLVRDRVPGEETKRDAVRVHFERVTGEHIDLFIPFRFNGVGRLEAGDPYQRQTMMRIFPRPLSPTGELMVRATTMAKERLAHAPEFLPFAVTMTTSGELQPVPSPPGGLSDVDQLAHLRQACRADAQRGILQGVVVCYCARVQGRTAVCVEIEHTTAPASRTFLAYTWTPPAPSSTAAPKHRSLGRYSPVNWLTG